MATTGKLQFDAYNDNEEDKNNSKPRIVKDDFTNDYQKYISGNHQISERLKNKLEERKIYKVVTDLLERKEIGIAGDVLKIPVHSKNGKIISIHSVSLLSKKKDDRYKFEKNSNPKGYLTAFNDKSSNRLYAVEGFCDFCSLCAAKQDINVVLIFTGNNYAILKQFSDYQIVSFLDNDAKGEEYNKKIHEFIPKASFADWDSITEKDVNELSVAGKKEVIVKLLENFVEYCKLPLNLEILGVFDFINKTRPPREVMLDPWLLEKQFVVISGERGVGKSMVALSLCIHLSMGTELFNWKPTKRYKTLYIDGEMTPYDTIGRVKRFNIEKCTDLNEYFYIYSVMDQDTTIQAHLTDSRFRKKIEEICIELGIQLVVFDNKSSLTPGIDENCKKDWDAINQYLVSLRSKGINPVLVTHKGKSTKGPRGTSGIEDHNDISIELTKAGNQNLGNGCKFNAYFNKMRQFIKDFIRYHRLSFEKNSDDDYFQWVGKDSTQEYKDKFICLALNDGISQKNIAEKYNIWKGTVSKKRTKYIGIGYIDDQDELTKNGRLWVSDAEEMYYGHENNDE